MFGRKKHKKPAEDEYTEFLEYGEDETEEADEIILQFSKINSESDGELPEEEESEETFPGYGRSYKDYDDDDDDDDDEYDDDDEDDEPKPLSPKAKKVLAVIAGIVALAVIVLAAVYFLQPKISPDYTNALNLMNEGSYAQAQEIFDALGDYHESRELSLQCRYSAAQQLFDSGDYEQAMAAFKALGDYNDCAARAGQCADIMKDNEYYAVLGLIDEGRYEEAIEALTAYGDYRDAKAKIAECYALIEEENYQALVASLEGADVLTAIEALEATNGYGDSAERIAALKETPEYYRLQFGEYNVGDRFCFGSYEQDNDSSNGKEPVEWIVLSKDEDSLMLISAEILDAKPYDAVIYATTWEHSELRGWLNDEFFNAAFSELEKSVLGLTHITTPANAFRNMTGGNDTDDYVFLLSFEEAESLFASDEARRAQPTAYARANGARYGEEIREYTQFWLRTAGWDHRYAVYVHADGHVKNYDSWQVYDKTLGVRPCITIDFK